MNGKSNEKISLETQVKRLYFKNWRDNNKDKVKKHNQNFWQKRVKELEEKKNSASNS